MKNPLSAGKNDKSALILVIAILFEKYVFLAMATYIPKAYAGEN